MADETPQPQPPAGNGDKLPLTNLWEFGRYVIIHNGVSVLALCVACWWFATNVGQPLIKAHMDFLERQIGLAENQQKVLEQAKVMMAEHKRLVLENHAKMLSDDAKLIENDTKIIDLLGAEKDQGAQQITILKRMAESIEKKGGT